MAWYHAFVVGPSRQIVAVSDLEVPLPTAPGLEIRTHGLWADHTCETPLDHWTVGNEAFGLGVDDASRAVRRRARRRPGAARHRSRVGDRGHAVPLRRHHPLRDPLHRFTARCSSATSGSTIDGHGQRDHSWGVRDWWQFGWCWTSGRLDDGTRFHGSDIRIPGVDVGFGYVQRDGAMSTTNTVHAEEDTDGDGFPSHGSVTIGDLGLDIEPIGLRAGPADLERQGQPVPEGHVPLHRRRRPHGPGVDGMEPARQRL